MDINGFTWQCLEMLLFCKAKTFGNCYLFIYLFFRHFVCMAYDAVMEDFPH